MDHILNSKSPGINNNETKEFLKYYKIYRIICEYRGLESLRVRIAEANLNWIRLSMWAQIGKKSNPGKIDSATLIYVIC